MQILHSDRKKGILKVQTQGLDDLWILYNTIQQGDIVGARTFRRVVRREGDKGERKPMHLDLKVEKVEFHEFSNRLRIKGQIIRGPDEFISIGQYHTINVEIGTKLTIIKDKWLKYEINRIEHSTKGGTNQIIMVVAIESGLANIGLISDYSLTISSSIRHNIPGKRYLKQNFNLEVQKFLDQTTQVILENIKNHNIQLIILCGPGFIKEKYQKMLGEILKREHLDVGIRVSTASSGTKSAIIEILKNGTISKYFSTHRLSVETRYVETFIERLGKDNGLFTYGIAETMSAAETGAVEHLLVTDLKMREIGSKHKERIEDLFLMVEKNRGKVHIVSTLHPAGEQIQNYGGVISLLRFKVQ